MSGADTNLKAFQITRIFKAPRALVFDAWTQKEHLARWFGPKGVSLQVKSLELTPGGVFLYAMSFPGKPAMWGRWVFKEVVRPERIVLISSFSDENGGITPNPWKPEWPLETLAKTTFTDQGPDTLVTLEWTPIRATPGQIGGFNEGKSGMEAGWTGTFEALAEYLKSLIP